MSKLVSVIVPTYRHGPLVLEALTSLLEQDYAPLEVVVVNDGSPDNTAELLAPFRDRIVYIEQENRGVTGARNSGLRAATGDYIAFLDGDDLLPPGSLTRRAEFLDAHPDISLVCGDAWLKDEHGINGRLSSRGGRPQNPANFRWETLEFCPLPSATMLRREAFESAGLFDEGLRRAGAEDWLLWIRMSLHINMAYLDEPLAIWRIQGQNTSNNLEVLNTNYRYAIHRLTSGPEFKLFPRYLRARLLYRQFAAVWREAPLRAGGYWARAMLMDPREAPYGWRTLKSGLINTLRRGRGASR